MHEWAFSRPDGGFPAEMGRFYGSSSIVARLTYETVSAIFLLPVLFCSFDPRPGRRPHYGMMTGRVWHMDVKTLKAAPADAEQAGRASGKRIETRVLLVEDSESVRQMIGEYLRNNGMQVDNAWSIAAARRSLDLFKPDLVLLDLSLEDGEAFDLLTSISRSEIPCIVVSARESAIDRVLSLELGAQDYIVKPVELRELLLRMRIALRSTNQRASLGTMQSLVFGDLEVDQVEREMMSADKKQRVPLTSSEFIVLRLLIANSSKFVERTEMARVIGRSRMTDQSRALDVLVSRLRSKIKQTGSSVTIKNVRGLGYAIY